MRPIRSLKEYESRYKNYKGKLFRFTKKEVEDFDKAANTKGEHYVLKHRKWVLLGDTYYEIPKAPRATWFKGLSAAGKLGACSVLIGGAGAIGGGAYGIYAAINNANKLVIIDPAIAEYVKVNKITKDSDGNTVISMELIKDPKEITVTPAVYKGDHLLEKGTDYIAKTTGDKTVDLIINKEAMDKYPGKIKIKAEDKSKGIEVSEEQWKSAIEYLMQPQEDSRNVTANFTQTLSGGSKSGQYLLIGKEGKEKVVGSDKTSNFRRKQNHDYYDWDKDNEEWVKITEDVDKHYMFDTDDVNSLLGILLESYDYMTFTDGIYSVSAQGKEYKAKFEKINNKPYLTYMYMASSRSSIEFTFDKYESTKIDDFPTDPIIEGITSKQWDNAIDYLSSSERLDKRNVTITDTTVTAVTYKLDGNKECFDNGSSQTYTKLDDDTKYYQYDGTKWGEKSNQRFEFDDETNKAIFNALKGQRTLFKYDSLSDTYSGTIGQNTYTITFGEYSEVPLISTILIENTSLGNKNFIFSDYGDTEIDDFPEIKLDETEVSLKETESATIAATICGDGSKHSFDFEITEGSDYISIAKNNNECTITAKSGGTATIKCSVDTFDDVYCTVTVEEAAPYAKWSSENFEELGGNTPYA